MTDRANRHCNHHINSSHLLEKVLAEQQDAGGSGEDDVVLSTTLAASWLPAENPGGKGATSKPTALQHSTWVQASFLLKVEVLQGIREEHTLVPMIVTDLSFGC